MRDYPRRCLIIEELHETNHISDWLIQSPAARPHLPRPSMLPDLFKIFRLDFFSYKHIYSIRKLRNQIRGKKFGEKTEMFGPFSAFLIFKAI